MKRTSRLGLALAGLLMAGLVAAAPVLAALPEFQNKALLSSIFFDNGAAILKAQTSGATVKCEDSSLTGEVPIALTKKLKEGEFTFTNCTGEGVNCTTTGQAAGTIKSEALEGTIGYLVTESIAEAKKVALTLTPATGGVLAKFTCKEGYEYTGCVAGELGEANANVTFFTMKLEETAGVQDILEFEPEKGTKKECKSKIKIGANAAESVGLETTQVPSVIGCPNMEKIKT
ncbi:MAG TPA: hypothetical protein VK778_11365 [Solirubrobacteraceae bacterium]|jgi:hypothetical protein|nr:hypothetical protein [Solirubrobacteraceae bacterium]